MDRLVELKDKFNTLSPFQKVAAIVVLILIGSIMLIMIVASILPKKPAQRQPLPPIPVFNPSPTPSVATSAAKLSIPSPFQGTTVSSGTIKDDYVYYLSDGGTTFYKTSLDGKDKRPLTEPLVAQIKQVIWSPDKSSAILKIENNRYFLGKNNSPFLSETDENLAITNWLYNFSTGSFKKLDSSIEPIAYSPDGSRLVYIKADKEDNLNKVYTANADGISEQFIVELPELFQDNLVFINNDTILTYATPHGYGRNIIYTVNLIDKTYQKLIDNEFTFDAKPSPNGSFVLAQTVQKDPDVFYKNFLSLIDMQQRKLSILDIQTSPGLAVWSGDSNLFYAFESGKLWAINVSALTKQQVDVSDEFKNLKIDEGSLLFSSDNNALLFTSEGKLYSLKLNQ